MAALPKCVEPRERGILFSAPMVLAILDGRKTVTRRIVKNPNVLAILAENGKPGEMLCPHGRPGDRLWVRETWCDPTDDRSVIYRADMSDTEIREEASVRRAYPALVRDYPDSRWRPSIFMPRWASRITLEIVDVRVERLQEITEEDARAEGVTPIAGISDEQNLTTGENFNASPHRSAFACLWDEINRDRVLWKANPWVRRVEFRRVKP